jgi:hypothetical protein
MNTRRGRVTRLARDLKPLTHSAGIGVRRVVDPPAIDLDAREPIARGVADPAVVTPADRHQPFADIGARGHGHAQTQGRILMHVAPIGAKEETALRFAERCKIARRAIAHAIAHAPARGRELRGEKLQQRRFAGAGFPHHGDHLARIKGKRDVAAAELLAVPFAQAFGDKKRLIFIALDHGAPS